MIGSMHLIVTFVICTYSIAPLSRYAEMMLKVREYRRSLYDRVGDRPLMDVLNELAPKEIRDPAIQERM